MPVVRPVAVGSGSNGEVPLYVWAFGAWLYAINVPIVVLFVPTILAGWKGVAAYGATVLLLLIRAVLPVLTIRGSTVTLRTLIRTRRFDVDDVLSAGWGKFGRFELVTCRHHFKVFRLSRLTSSWKQWGKNPDRLQRAIERMCSGGLFERAAAGPA